MADKKTKIKKVSSAASVKKVSSSVVKKPEGKVKKKKTKVFKWIVKFALFLIVSLVMYAIAINSAITDGFHWTNYIDTWYVGFLQTMFVLLFVGLF